MGLSLLLSLGNLTAAEYLGKAAYLNAGALWVQDLPDGVPQKVMTGNVWAPRFSNNGRWLLNQDDETLQSAEVFDPTHPQSPPHRLRGEDICW